MQTSYVHHPSSEEAGAVFDPPSEAVALSCSFLLGLGDAAGSTQMTSIVGGVSDYEIHNLFDLFNYVCIKHTFNDLRACLEPCKST